MDTPAVGRLGDFGHLALYRRWRAVRVAEDFMNMSQFRLVETVINSGVLGEIRHLRLTNMGYRYHALALLRCWLAFPLVRSARCLWSRGGAVNVVYRFPGSVTAEVIEPYTRGQGSFEVVGTHASITGHMMGYGISNGDALPGPDSRADGACGRLERLEDENGLSGFQIVGLGSEFKTSVRFLAQLRAMGLADNRRVEFAPG